MNIESRRTKTDDRLHSVCCCILVEFGASLSMYADPSGAANESPSKHHEPQTNYYALKGFGLPPSVPSDPSDPADSLKCPK